jgi:predicted dehydrogenase
MSKIRWGVIGGAAIARHRTLPAMKQAPHVELTALASRSADKAAALCTELGIPTAYGSYEQLLADPDIDAVYLPLPNHLHCEWAVKSMEAGKHVLCEKPLSLSIAEIEQLKEVRDRTGRHIGGVRLPQPSAMGADRRDPRFGNDRRAARHAGDDGYSVPRPERHPQ